MKYVNELVKYIEEKKISGQVNTERAFNNNESSKAVAPIIF